MGLLDDLRNQADSKRASEEEEANRVANREQYYLDKIQPRIVKTYQFFNELVEHLNYIKLETIVEYPLQPGGAPQRLRQEGYKVVIDSSKAIKKVDFSMEGVLDEPVEFEVFGRDAVANHVERIQRYSFRHKCKVRKDAEQYVQSALFTLEGPLPLRVSIEADVPTSKIKVTVRNFTEPGFSSRALTVEEFDDEFLDKIGKFVLRQEPTLFGSAEELSEEAKKKIRDRMIVEARIRQQELIEAEEKRKAEEAAELEKSTKEQLKRAVNTKVAKGKESLKDMFGKLKKQAGFDSNGAPASKQAPKQATAPQQTPMAPAAPAQARQAPVAPAQARQQAPVPPSVPAQTRQAPAGKQAQIPPARPATATPKAQPAPAAQKAQTPPAAQQKPVPPAAPKSEAPAAKAPPANAPTTNTQATPAAPRKKASPPKVFNVEGPNPFLTPETEPELEATKPSGSAVDSQSADKKIDAAEEKQNAESSAVKTESSNHALSAEALERDLADIIERDKTDSSSDGSPDSTEKKSALETPAAKPAKPYIKPGELITDLSMELELPKKDKTVEEQSAPISSEPAATDSIAPTQNPFLTKDETPAAEPAVELETPEKDKVDKKQAPPKVVGQTAPTQKAVFTIDETPAAELELPEKDKAGEQESSQKTEESTAADQNPVLSIDETPAAELELPKNGKADEAQPSTEKVESNELSESADLTADSDDSLDIDLAISMPQFNVKPAKKSPPAEPSIDTSEPKLTLSLEDDDQANTQPEAKELPVDNQDAIIPEAPTTTSEPEATLVLKLEDVDDTENQSNTEKEAPLELNLEPPTDDSTPKDSS